MLDRLHIIFSKSELKRLSIARLSSHELQITANVHGLKCYEAKRFINNIINILQSTFKLTIIHGYNHSTSIKDMLTYNFTNPHIVEQYVPIYNPGITCMSIYNNYN